jgi:hypothetical protein
LSKSWKNGCYSSLNFIFVKTSVFNKLLLFGMAEVKTLEVLYAELAAAFEVERKARLDSEARRVAEPAVSVPKEQKSLNDPSIIDVPPPAKKQRKERKGESLLGFSRFSAPSDAEKGIEVEVVVPSEARGRLEEGFRVFRQSDNVVRIVDGPGIVRASFYAVAEGQGQGAAIMALEETEEEEFEDGAASSSSASSRADQYMASMRRVTPMESFKMAAEAMVARNAHSAALHAQMLIDDSSWCKFLVLADATSALHLRVPELMPKQEISDAAKEDSVRRRALSGRSWISLTTSPRSRAG